MMMVEGSTSTGSNAVCLALIDSIPLTRLSLTRFLGEHMRDCVVLPFSGAEGICSSASPLPTTPDLVILHVGARRVHEDESLDAEVERLRACMPDVPIVLFCDRDDALCVVQALTKGIRGYIPTAFDTQVVIGALRLVLAGGIFVPAGPVLEALGEYAASSLDERTHDLLVTAEAEGFTPRQLDVLRLLRQGKSNKIIAFELNVEESTVKVHVRHIMKKLSATNRTHAVVLANQLWAGQHEP